MKPRPSPDPSTLGAALAWARRELSRSESGALEAEVLLAFAAKITRVEILAHPEAALSPHPARSYFSLVARCAAGEPLAYLTGEQEFFGLAFTVTPDVLIPRPETELLVETALGWLSARNNTARVIDVGTGSGCIAVTLATRAAGLQIVATDISSAALGVAQQNIFRHKVAGRVIPVQADLLAPLPGPFDLICANLPYIPAAALGKLPVVRQEPRLALDGGPDGLRCIERLLAQAHTRLAPGGCMLLEIESSLGDQSLDLARRYWADAAISLRKDLAGLDRLLEIINKLPPP